MQTRRKAGARTSLTNPVWNTPSRYWFSASLGLLPPSCPRNTEWVRPSEGKAHPKCTQVAVGEGDRPPPSPQSPVRRDEDAWRRVQVWLRCSPGTAPSACAVEGGPSRARRVPGTSKRPLPTLSAPPCGCSSPSRATTSEGAVTPPGRSGRCSPATANRRSDGHANPSRAASHSAQPCSAGDTRLRT
jgi:hypothetical protein